MKRLVTICLPFTLGACAFAPAPAALADGTVMHGSATEVSTGGSCTLLKKDAAGALYSCPSTDVISGSLNGPESSSELLWEPAGTTALYFAGITTCTCTVDDPSGTPHSGTLVYAVVGSGSTSSPAFSGRFRILQGTGGLANLRGYGTFVATNSGGTFSTTLWFA
ncbi:MAG: DUF3224 domain-containing protein [Chloroflexi bacterium]|nr:DUF3224 domain-containing protein [Chloroflexota bacterium]